MGHGAALHGQGTDAPSAAEPQPQISVSRSDTLMIARRFNAGTRRMTAGLRRVATLEASELASSVATRRTGLLWPIPPALEKAGLPSGHRYAMHERLQFFAVREEIG